MLCWIKRWHDQTDLCEMGSTLQFWEIIVFHLNSQSLVSVTLLPVFHHVSVVMVVNFTSCVRRLIDDDCWAYSEFDQHYSIHRWW